MYKWGSNSLLEILVSATHRCFENLCFVEQTEPHKSTDATTGVCHSTLIRYSVQRSCEDFKYVNIKYTYINKSICLYNFIFHHPVKNLIYSACVESRRTNTFCEYLDAYDPQVRMYQLRCRTTQKRTAVHDKSDLKSYHCCLRPEKISKTGSRDGRTSWISCRTGTGRC